MNKVRDPESIRGRQHARERERNQNMDMIADSADGERFHFILLRDAAKVWPEAVSQIGA